MCLNFPLGIYVPEGFTATLVQTKREFCAFPTLVWLASHLPSLLRIFNFFSATRTLSHLVCLTLHRYA